MNVTDDNIYKLLRPNIPEKYTRKDVLNSSDLSYDFKFDSLDHIEIAIRLEEEFVIRIPDENVDGLFSKSFQQLRSQIEIYWQHHLLDIVKKEIKDLVLIENKVAKAVKDALRDDMSIEDVKKSKDFLKDFNTDSLDQVVIVMNLEKEFSIKIDEEHALPFKNVKNIITKIQNYI